jgi:hypothetical protein
VYILDLLILFIVVLSVLIRLALRYVFQDHLLPLSLRQKKRLQRLIAAPDQVREESQPVPTVRNMHLALYLHLKGRKASSVPDGALPVDSEEE